MAPGASHPGLERAIKCSGARHGIRAIFPSRGRSRIFSWGVGWEGRKKRKKEKRPSTVLPPLPSTFWSPGTAWRHPGLPEVTSCPAFIVACSVSPRLCPPLARQSSPGLYLLICQMDPRAPRPLREAPSSSVFLQAWTYQGQGQGSSGVAKKLSQNQRREVGFSPTQVPCSWALN